MSQPFIFVGTFEIPSGGYDAAASTGAGMLEIVRSGEPRTVSFNFYINAEHSEGTVVQVYEDAAAFSDHMRVAAAQIQKGQGTVQVRHIEIYGDIDPAVLEQLKRSGPVTVKQPWQGYTRPG